MLTENMLVATNKNSPHVAVRGSIPVPGAGVEPARV